MVNTHHRPGSRSSVLFGRLSSLIESGGRRRLNSNPIRPQAGIPTVKVDDTSDNPGHTGSPDSQQSNSIRGGSNAQPGADGDSNGPPPASPTDSTSSTASNRRVYFNRELPLDPDDPDGGAIDLPEYPRNKIRSAKYTPLSFLPKNLWYQFHNVANLYFLFTIILGAFPVFGVVNPALNAVPLIVILFLTAVKDAIEDWGRTSKDHDLNNTPVKVLANYKNVNVSDDSVSLWRRVKKRTSRYIRTTWHLFRGKKNAAISNAVSQVRASMDAARASLHLRRSTDTGRRSVDQTGRFSMNLSVPGRESRLEPDPSAIQNPRRRIDKFPKFETKTWKDVRVGDVVRVFEGEEIPADIVIMSTSDKEHDKCYIETKNLDGETNLKLRKALSCSQKVLQSHHLAFSEFEIECAEPDANLYSCNGSVYWGFEYPQENGDPHFERFTMNNVLLRGSTLRNTENVLGIVLYTGADTKVMLNAGLTPSKRARLSRDLNRTVLYNFIILFFMCLIAGLVNGVTWAKGGNSQDFFEYGSYGNSAVLNGFITFWAGVILFQNLVPISLYITLEIIRTLQALFIANDLEMYDEAQETPCSCKSWNISDDLGQIEYVFSDKTGTLTQNVMEFKKCSIDGRKYGVAYTEAEAGIDRRNGLDVRRKMIEQKQRIEDERQAMLDTMRNRLPKNDFLKEDEVVFISSECANVLTCDDSASPHQLSQREKVREFMFALAICNSVEPVVKSGEAPSVVFNAQSPDETALVETARDFGYVLIGRSGNYVTLKLLGETVQVEVLAELEFSSDRKRSSTIIRHPDGRIVMYCKGADNVVFDRLMRGHDNRLKDQTEDHLEEFSREGLRTLCIAYRELGEEFFGEWKKRFDLAQQDLTNSAQAMEPVAADMECSLHLLGCTAIEDRLQDGVPEAIERIGLAGVKLWVLTGDKVETAINIGYSCNLLNTTMTEFHIDVDTTLPSDLRTTEEEKERARDQIRAAVAAKLDQHLANFRITGSDEDLKKAQTDHEPPAPWFALIIRGDVLEYLLEDGLKRKFLLLGQKCRSVLCCRVSPAQKAEVVRMVKTGLDCLTLAIGDGANDVAMIQEAHVGVGIAGREGRAAAVSSDYAIGQFKFLTRLLLVHGRWSYRRLAETTCNFFYKNVIWAFSLFWYNIYASFDCPNVFDYTYIILYNLAFTSLPVILLGVFDQDVGDRVSLAVPQLFRRGIERKEWTELRFWAYMVDGLYQSVIVYFFAHLVFYTATFATDNGLDIADTKRIGVFVAATAVIVSNFYIILNLYRWDWLTVLITAISILLFFFWTGVYTTTVYSQLFYKAAPQVFGQPSFWAMLFLAITACLLPRLLVKYAQKTFFPHDVDLVREMVAAGTYDYVVKKGDFDYLPPMLEDMQPQGQQHQEAGRPSSRDSVQSRPDYGRPGMMSEKVGRAAFPLQVEEEEEARPMVMESGQARNHDSVGSTYTSPPVPDGHMRGVSVTDATTSR